MAQKPSRPPRPRPWRRNQIAGDGFVFKGDKIASRKVRRGWDRVARRVGSGVCWKAAPPWSLAWLRKLRGCREVSFVRHVTSISTSHFESQRRAGSVVVTSFWQHVRLPAPYWVACWWEGPPRDDETAAAATERRAWLTRGEREWHVDGSFACTSDYVIPPVGAALDGFCAAHTGSGPVPRRWVERTRMRSGSTYAPFRRPCASSGSTLA
jgi:hypothetical protein